MKRFTVILLLTLSMQSQAQDWQSVQLYDTTLFHTVASGVDSHWNNYLRGISTDSVNINFSFTKLHFYPSLRPDKNGLYDSTTKDTWLGPHLTRLPNGDEIFFNVNRDTLLIKTKAVLNDTWTFCSDSTGLRYEATVSSLGTQIVDGILDSTKTIDLQAYQGATPVSSALNSLKIILSKNHGFLEIFEFYSFPYQETAIGTTPLNNWPQAIFPFPRLPIAHTRIPTSLRTVDMRQNNTVRYVAGNEWVFHEAQTLAYNYQHDSVIQVTPIGGGQIQAQILRRRVEHSVNLQGPTPIINHSNVQNLELDTLDASPPPASSWNAIVPEHRSNVFGIGYSSIPWTLGTWKVQHRFIDTFCGNKLIIRDSSKTSTAMSGWYSNAGESMQFFGQSYWSHTSYQTGPVVNGHSRLIYLKLDSCEYGTKPLLRSIGVNDFQKDLRSQFTLYPNPSQNFLWIDKPDQFEIQGIRIYNLSMQKLHAVPNIQGPIDISQLPQGQYLLEVHTDKGRVLKPFIHQ